MLTLAVDGFIVGKGHGGGIRALAPAFTVGPDDGVLLATREGRMNLSATLALSFDVALPIYLGGKHDRTKRIPLLVGRDDPDIESQCLFLSSIGIKPWKSRDMNLKERRDSNSSNWKFGLVRYFVDSVDVSRG